MATLKLRNGTTVTVPDKVATDYTRLTPVGGEEPVAQKRRRTSTPAAIVADEAQVPIQTSEI